MKKLLLLSLILSFVSCSTPPPEQKAVMDYLKYHPDNIKKYTPVKWGSLDSLFIPFEEHSTTLMYYDRRNHLLSLIEQTLKESAYYRGTGTGHIFNLEIYHTALERIDHVLDSARASYVPIFIGFTLRHKYKAKKKNTDNVVLYDEVFCLDSTLTVMDKKAFLDL